MTRLVEIPSLEQIPCSKLAWGKKIQEAKILKFGLLLKLPQKFEIAQKINSVPFGPVTEPKGFKPDMHGPEHEIDQKVNGIDQIVNGIDQIVNGIDQIVNDHFLG